MARVQRRRYAGRWTFGSGVMPHRRLHRVRRIISGGQTGADRGGLDAALQLGIPHGGWCPRGRKAEDGTVPLQYQLGETVSFDYAARTGRNVAEADGTVIFTHGRLIGGSKLTAAIAMELRRPLLHLDLNGDRGAATTQFTRWLTQYHINVLNIAGSRESEAPGIHSEVLAFVRGALATAEQP